MTNYPYLHTLGNASAGSDNLSATANASSSSSDAPSMTMTMNLNSAPSSSTARHRRGSDPMSMAPNDCGDFDPDDSSAADPSTLTLLSASAPSSSSSDSTSAKTHVAIPMHGLSSFGLGLDKHRDDRRSRATTAHSGYSSRRSRSHSHSHSRSRSRSPSSPITSLFTTKPTSSPYKLAVWVVGSLALILVIVVCASLLTPASSHTVTQDSTAASATRLADTDPPSINPISPAIADLTNASRRPTIGDDTVDNDVAHDSSDTSYVDDINLSPTSRPAAHSLALARSRHRLPSRLSKLGLELGNLAPILTASAPRSPPLQRQIGLLAIPVGAKSRALISPVIRKFKQAGFHIYLFHYDTSGPWHEFAREFPSVTAPGQAKFWFAKRYLPPQVVENYEYIFLWDDDVGFLDMDQWDPREFVRILREYAIHVAQPAIVDGLKDYAQAKVVKWDPRAGTGRWTSFVEMMFGVYSREAWQSCIWELLPWNGRSYWGTDFAFFPHCAAAGYCRVAVIDAMPVRHMDKHLFKSVSMENMREMRMYVDAYVRIMCDSAAYGDDEADERARGRRECKYLKAKPIGSHVESFRRIEDGDAVDKGSCPGGGQAWWKGVQNLVQADHGAPEWQFVKVDDRKP